VEDGEAACRAVLAEPFDLVILDVVMPGMQCREVIRRIRAVRPETRILLSSGYTAGASLGALTQQTGLELLRKPYDPDQMLRTVRGALDSVPPPPDSLPPE
jgi:DNA-binding NtrC family response regulator